MTGSLIGLPGIVGVLLVWCGFRDLFLVVLGWVWGVLIVPVMWFVDCCKVAVVYLVIGFCI